MFGQKTPLDYIFGILALLLLIGQIVLPWMYWNQLPASIPVHFNLAGQPDNYGSKLMLLLIPVVGLALFVLLTVVGLYPQNMNLPFKVTEENQEMVFQAATRFVHILRVFIGALLLYLIWGSIEVGLGLQKQLDNRVLFGLGGSLLFYMVLFWLGVWQKTKQE